MGRRLAPVLLATVTLAGCSDPPPVTPFSKDDAETFVQAWGARVIQGDLDRVLYDCAVPFRFRTRTWRDEEEVRRNLAVQLPVLQEQLLEPDLEIEAFSHHDLSKGRWPRDEDLGLTKIGVRPGGFLVWIREEHTTALHLVVNPSPARERLLVQAVDPR